MLDGIAPNRPSKAEIDAIADTDFTERDRSSGEDHAAHAPGKTCAKCGDPIALGQDARRRGESGWVHDVCPLLPGLR